MKKLVVFSVIVPVYNIEKYLPRCINSILSQTYSDFELILVDDGSTDNSGLICDEYAEKDKRIRVYHKPNGGVSSARNMGIDHATGEFIVFIDSDDVADSCLLQNLAHSDCDLVSIGFDDYSPNNTVKKSFLEPSFSFSLDSEENILQFVSFSGYVFVWAKRYKRSIIVQNNIRFNENLEFSEDIIFNNAYILKCFSLENISAIGYHHCHYEKPTLGFRTWEYPLVNRLDWREICYEQFDGFLQVQEFFMRQLIFLVEKELVKISNSEDTYPAKARRIKTLINHPFVRKCIFSKYNSLSLITNLLIRIHCYFLLAYRYNNRQ